MTYITERDLIVKKWMEEFAAYIREQRSKKLQIEEKTASNDLVTNMDKYIEKELVKKIREHFPEDKIVGEEGFGDQVDSMDGTVWFLDPIDGTLNFVLQQENFAIMIAIYENGKAMQSYIYDVIKDKLYYAIRDAGVYCNGQLLKEPENLAVTEGMVATNTSLMVKEKYSYLRKVAGNSLGLRMIGSAGLEIVEVAKGNVVAYVASNLKPWDVAPALLFMEEMGMKATTFDNQPINLLTNNSIVFATQSAHRDIMTFMS